MTGMDDLVTWLRAQLDDDERVAREVVESIERAFPDAEFDVSWAWSVRTTYRALGSGGTSSVPGAPTPAERLAEIDAKRRILDQVEMWLRGHDPERASEFPGTTGGVAAMLTVVRTLAVPYADRPGYQEEWRPA